MYKFSAQSHKRTQYELKERSELTVPKKSKVDVDGCNVDAGGGCAMSTSSQAGRAELT